MGTIQVQERLNKFIETIITECNPEKIVLYGSNAKDINYAERDIDIVVIVNEGEGNFLE